RRSAPRGCSGFQGSGLPWWMLSYCHPAKILINVEWQRQAAANVRRRLMQSFHTAKNVLYILMYVGWTFVTLCALGGLIAIFQSDTSPLLVIVGAFIASVLGFLIVAIAQMGLSQIATAESTGAMLQIMRENGEREVAEQKPSVASPKRNVSNSALSPEVGSVLKTYKGYEIVRTQTGVFVDGREFFNVFAAEDWINKNPKV
ncbi:MAG: hypothetical protein RQ750_17335, partial [Roseovarius sp.]|nr:hypothetical protein [Roseovarius sp.]